jgi:hypothetical protein
LPQIVEVCDAREHLTTIPLTVSACSRRQTLSLTVAEKANKIVHFRFPDTITARRKRKWEVHHVDTSTRPILWFDRHHPSAPTCTRLVPARAVAVKDGPSSGHRVSGAQRP